MPQQPQPPHDKEAGTVERRFFKTEARAAKADGEKMSVGGYGALFNQYSNLGWYAEVVLPGFFDGIKDDRCACLFNHDENQVLGRKRNNTLVLKTDANGLDYQATALPSSRADVFELIEGGYVYESSFSFTTAEARWSEVDRAMLADKLSEDDLNQLSYGGKITVRELVKGKELFDVSPVTFAQYEGTTIDTRIAKRSFNSWKEEHHDTPDQPNHRLRIAEALERATASN